MHRYRPLLPATRPYSTGHKATQGAAPKKKRPAVSVACNPCRTKKTGCDGNRPTCSRCAKRGLDCVYISPSADKASAMVTEREITALKTDYDRLVELFDILRTCPEDRSINILKQLRSAKTDPAGLIHFINNDTSEAVPLPKQVLEYPPKQNGLEFELMVRHAIPYPALLPLDATIDHEFRSELRDELNIPFPRPSISPTLQHELSSTPTGVNTPTSSPNYCDARLAQIKIGLWSQIKLTNELAARLISLYLVTDHPILGIFDAQLFVTDLIENRPRYCSDILVSAILSWACHAYSTIMPEATAMSRAFFDQADALLHQGSPADLLTTVSATHLLSLSSIYNGIDAGLPYFNMGVEMALRMGLLGLSDDRIPYNGRGKQPDHLARATSHTAWGTFNWITMRSFMFQEKELAVKSPPHTRIPGRGSHLHSHELAVDGEVADDLPAYMDRTFPAMCQFWLITSEWISVYYSDEDRPVSDRVPVEFAESIFRKLLAWADNLHTILARGGQSRHHGIILHIWYHASILQIFRPFTQSPTPSMLRIVAMVDGASAKAIFTASLNQLKHLVIVFRSTYPCANYAILWHVGLLCVANAALSDTDDPQWRGYFALCVNSYGDLYGAFRVAMGIVKSLLLIAIKRGALSLAEA